MSSPKQSRQDAKDAQEDGGKEIALSTTEWNKLRKQLGLRPLDQTDSTTGKPKQGSLHAPLSHWEVKEEQRKQERENNPEYRQQMNEIQKRKRDRCELLKDGKGLGDILDMEGPGPNGSSNSSTKFNNNKYDDDLKNWALKGHSNNADAIKRRKEEDERKKEERERRKKRALEARGGIENDINMDNFRVQHDLKDLDLDNNMDPNNLQADQGTILTLADTRIYNKKDGKLTQQDDLDILENVDQARKFKDDQNKKRKQMIRNYDPSRGVYDVSGIDPNDPTQVLGMNTSGTGSGQGGPNLLSKYDDLPNKKEGFLLGTAQSKLNAEQGVKNLLRDIEIGNNNMSSSSAYGGTGLKFQRDQMTEEEEKKWRKKQMKREEQNTTKIKKRGFGKSDIKKSSGINNDKDTNGNNSDDEGFKLKSSSKQQSLITTKKLKAFRAPKDVDSDEDDPELYELLRKQRTASQLQAVSNNKLNTAGALKSILATHGEEKPLVQDTNVVKISNTSNSDNSKFNTNKTQIHTFRPNAQTGADALTLTENTEFCATMATNAEKQQRKENETFTGSRLFKEEQLEKKKTGQQGSQKNNSAADEQQLLQQQQLLQGLDGATIAGGEELLKNKNGNLKTLNDSESSDVNSSALHEKALDNSIASALQKLRNGGNLNSAAVRNVNSSIPARVARREGGLMLDNVQDDPGAASSSSIAFSESLHGKYDDEFGRTNTKKAMFRQISWAFHGQKQHAKNETKRKQHLEMENRIQSMDLSMPPTLKALQKQQEKSKLPYMSLGN